MRVAHWESARWLLSFSAPRHRSVLALTGCASERWLRCGCYGFSMAYSAPIHRILSMLQKITAPMGVAPCASTWMFAVTQQKNNIPHIAFRLFFMACPPRYPSYVSV